MFAYVYAAGIVGIARCSGLSIVENEILPQCWEQISHKHVERRLLVAESCIALVPYVSVSNGMTKLNCVFLLVCSRVLVLIHHVT